MKRNVFSVSFLALMLALLALVTSGGCGGSSHDDPISNNTDVVGGKLPNQC